MECGDHVADLIGETLPEVMEQLIREYPPKEGDISRIMQIPSSEIINLIPKNAKCCSN